jgi:hypothetical protein
VLVLPEKNMGSFVNTVYILRNGANLPQIPDHGPFLPLTSVGIKLVPPHIGVLKGHDEDVGVTGLENPSYGISSRQG